MAVSKKTVKTTSMSIAVCMLFAVQSITQTKCNYFLWAYSSKLDNRLVICELAVLLVISDCSSLSNPAKSFSISVIRASRLTHSSSLLSKKLSLSKNLKKGCFFKGRYLTILGVVGFGQFGSSWSDHGPKPGSCPAAIATMSPWDHVTKMEHCLSLVVYKEMQTQPGENPGLHTMRRGGLKGNVWTFHRGSIIQSLFFFWVMVAIILVIIHSTMFTGLILFKSVV